MPQHSKRLSPVIILNYILIFLSLAALLPPWHWTLEVLANFGHYFLAAHAVSTLILPFFWAKLESFRRALLLGLNLALAAAHFEPWIPFLHADAPERTAHAAETVSFLYANVHTANENYSALSALIDERKPQVLGLLELSGAWHEALKPQLDRYPAQAKILRDDNFGIGLFTNLTPAGEPEDFGGDIVPAFLFPLVTPGGRRIDVILLHCRPPLLDDRIYTNWLLLRRVSSRIRSSDNPLVVMGDFNATPNSRFYRNFTEWSGVQNLMHEAGWLTTWNARAPFLRFAIDHAFIKGVLPRAAPVRLPDIGSDHYPLGFEVGLQ